LVAALRIGERRAVTPADLTRRVAGLLARAGLPTDLARHDLGAAAGFVGHDKKRAGDGIRFVLASAPGSVLVERLTLAELREHLGALR
jgi:3-dehydroquinate synthetase